MAAPVQKLSHKQYRALLKKEKRKKKRQEAAKLRQQEDDENHSETLPGILILTEEELKEREHQQLQREEIEKEKAHRAWLQRERVAQILFERKKQQEKEWKEQQEEAERKIEDELERQKKMENEFLNSNNKRTKEEKLLEDALHVLSDGDDEGVDDKAQPTHNPEAPKYTERKQEDCMFYLKTGACRFGNRCSRHHAYPIISSTLLIRGMFTCYAMAESYRDEYDADIGLEFDETETQTAFLEFYDDVLEEFRKAGKVIQFKVCRNWEPHLRGNVYVEFETESGCSDAFNMFNARFYAGRQLSCEYCPVTNWKAAICGLFHRKKCPKGKNCNFLHVFRNPGNEFLEADLGPGMGSQRDGWTSQRSYIGTPMGSERSYRDYSRWYSRRDNRERRRYRRSRSREYYSRNRERSKSRERRRSRSRERRRSRSRERRRSRSRERRSKSRERRSRSRERQRSGSWERRSRSRERMRSKSLERIRSRERTRDRNKSRDRNRSRDRYSSRKTRKRLSPNRSNRDTRSRSNSLDELHSSSSSPESKKSQDNVNVKDSGKQNGEECEQNEKPKEASPFNDQNNNSGAEDSEESQMSYQRDQNVVVDGIKEMLENKYLKKHKKSKHKKHKKSKKRDKKLKDEKTTDVLSSCEKKVLNG